MIRSHFVTNPWLLATLALTAAQQANGQSTGNWNTNTSSSWNTVGNWTDLTGGLVPSAIDATANFTFQITAGRTITLDGDKTVGTMRIDDPPPASGTTYSIYTFNAGTTTSSGLIFDVANGSALLSSNTPSNTANSTINVPITLNDALTINWDKSGSTNQSQIILANTISDGASSFSITKTGNGIAAFNVANSYDGGTLISGGRITAANLGSYGTGAVAVASGGQAFLATSGTFANNFSLADNGYLLQSDQGALVGALRYSNNSTSGTITLTGDARIGAFSATTTGTMNGPLVGNFNLEINSPTSVNTNHNGNIFLNGNASAMTGTITVSQGSLTLGASANLGGSIVVTDGARLSGETSVAGSLTLGTSNGATLNFDPSTVAALAVGGNLTLNGVTAVVPSAPYSGGGNLPIVSYTGSLTGDLSNLSFSAGNYRPGTGLVLDTLQKLISLNVVSKALVWTGASNNEWNFADTNWADGVNPSNFFDLDGVTFNITPAILAATLTTNLSGFNDDLTFTARTPGAAGDAISIAYLDTFTANTAFGLAVSGNAITVTLAIDGTNSITTTAANIKSAIEASPAAAALVSVAFAAGNNGDGLVAVLPATNLVRTSGAVTIPSAVTVRPSSATFDNPADIGFRLSGPGTLTNAPIIKKGTGKLTVGDATSPGSTASVITGSSPITIEQGTLAGSSMTPISASTTITMGNASTGTAPTILEVPASQSASNDFVTLACPLVLSPDAPNSEAIVRYSGGPSVLAPSFSGPIQLNGRDLYLENTSGSNLPTRLYNVSGAISGNGNVRVRAGTLPSGEADGATRLRIISISNTFTGDLYIQKGSLQTGFSTTAGQEHIPNSALLIMSSGTVLGLATTAETIRGLVGGAATEAVPFTARIEQGRGDSNTTRLTVSDSNATNTHVFDGRIVNSSAGPMALTKAGAATQVLTGVNAYTGTTLINGGTLEIGGAGQLGGGTYSAAMTLGAGATFKYNSSADQLLQTGVISGAGALVKDNTGTLTLRGTNTFSGNITLNGGKLSAGVSGFGSASNTRTITVDSDAVLEFGAGNVFGNHATINVPEIIVNGGTITNTDLADNVAPNRKVNNALRNVTLNSGTLTATKGNEDSTDIRPGEGYGTWGLNGTVTSTGTSSIDTSAVVGKAGRVLLSSNTVDTVFNVASGTLTVLAPLQTGDSTPNYGLTKTGTGTLVLTAENVYITNTTVNDGTLALADNAQLKFVLGASSGVNNSLTGTGTVTLSGDFNIDTTAADALASGTWTLENVSTATYTPGASGFTVIGFNDIGGDQWEKDLGGGKKYTFDETTGVLTLASGSAYDSWAAAKGLTGLSGFENGRADDPDKDGRNNLQEFAFDGNPLSGANDGKVVGKVATVSAAQVLTLTLPVRNGAIFAPDSGDQLAGPIDGIYYRVEGGNDLVTFADNIAEVTTGDETTIQTDLPGVSSGWTYRTFRVSGTVSSVQKDFMRAKTSETP
jgi:autotransporter-associated beta strand protein